jgi:hypothetical protein
VRFNSKDDRAVKMKIEKPELTIISYSFEHIRFAGEFKIQIATSAGAIFYFCLSNHVANSFSVSFDEMDKLGNSSESVQFGVRVTFEPKERKLANASLHPIADASASASASEARSATIEDSLKNFETKRNGEFAPPVFVVSSVVTKELGLESNQYALLNRKVQRSRSRAKMTIGPTSRPSLPSQLDQLEFMNSERVNSRHIAQRVLANAFKFKFDVTGRRIKLGASLPNSPSPEPIEEKRNSKHVHSHE